MARITQSPTTTTAQLGEAFVPRPRHTPRLRTRSAQTTTTRTPIYFSPSNPFCTRSTTRTASSPYPRAARRLEFGCADPSEAGNATPENRWHLTREEMIEMAVMVVFWAALVVFLSAVLGFGAKAGVRTGTTVHDHAGRLVKQAVWNGAGERGRDGAMEGIWDAARSAN